MIKARQVAGDERAGERFLQRLAPFVWRKNLDFATIQDIHAIKRQINAHQEPIQWSVEGHNVKLGRGGIREVEFLHKHSSLSGVENTPNCGKLRRKMPYACLPIKD